MKLLRYGKVGQERPGALDATGRIRDLSRVIEDVTGAVLSQDSIGSLEQLDLSEFPIVEGRPRLGPCVGSVGKFVCIGYMNGGISASHTLHFIMAYHVVGEPEKGDEILLAMLERQARIGFEDGVRNRGNEGIDWTNWNGVPKGYEGYLADVFVFLQAAVLREPSLRARFYRPLSE